MKILLTGFEPFGGESVNPAQEAVQLVKDEIKGAEIVKCYVPVVFGKAIETVHAAMVKEKPDVVLFGSFARDEAQEGSDIDVMYLVDAPRSVIAL